MDIIVDEITKTYGRQNAVDELSFQVKTGEVLGFLGPNGAGKTTTMKAEDKRYSVSTYKFLSPVFCLPTNSLIMKQI